MNLLPSIGTFSNTVRWAVMQACVETLMNWTGPGLCQRHWRPASDVNQKHRRVRVSLDKRHHWHQGLDFLQRRLQPLRQIQTTDDTGDHKLRALVYDILLPATAVVACVTGLRKTVRLTDIFSLVLKWQ